jgi:carbon starvation protein
MMQDLLGQFSKTLGRTSSLSGNVVASALIVGGWGYFLYQGVIDPLGGINTLWPLFGIANQLLASIALTLGTTILIKGARPIYALCTALPLTWLVTVTMTAGWHKIWNADRRIGFLAQADFLQSQLATGAIAPEKIAETNVVIFAAQLDAVITGLFMAIVWIVLLDAARIWLRTLRAPAAAPSLAGAAS